MAKYAFLPWARQGLAGALGAGTPLVDGRAVLTASARVSTGAAQVDSTPVTLRLLGPGDVAGLDVSHVVRTDPAADSPGNETNCFPLVEFDRPDLPWLFTPQGTAGAQLRPWICLVVVQQRDGVTLTGTVGPKPQLLSIKNGAFSELPDLSQAWAWAHTQVALTEDAEAAPDKLAAAVANAPDRVRSRLVCPRALTANKSYYACVVPTYLGGVQAGLGLPVNAATVTSDAWAAGVDAIDLPVYYSWAFATGADGDFEALLAKLKARKLTLADVGTRKLDVSRAGYLLPAGDPAVDLEGALGPERKQSDVTVGPSATFQSRLQALVNNAAGLPVPVLTPPLYGRWHAGQRAIPDAQRDFPWLRQLNLDPRYRVAAGLGAQVVRDQQEALMASAWAQMGDVQRANQLIRGAQLARLAGDSVAKLRLGGLDPALFALVTAPAQPRIYFGAGLTARGAVAASALPVACTGTSWRRLLRVRGTQAKAFGVSGKAKRTACMTAINQSQVSGRPAVWASPPGMVSTQAILGHSPCGTDPQQLKQAILGKWSVGSLLSQARIVLAATQLVASRSGSNAQALAFLQQAAQDFTTAIDDFQKYQSPPAGTADPVLQFFGPGMLALIHGYWCLIIALLMLAKVVNILLQLAIAALKKVYESQVADTQAAVIGLALASSGQRFEPCSLQPPATQPPLVFGTFQTTVGNALNPATSLPLLLGSQITAPGWDPAKLDTILAAPDFLAPMFRELAARSQEWLLPGLAEVPPDTVTLLESNTRFIEAFMVGLNHEMSRELLWRGYPTDQRGSYFRQFWDPSGCIPAPTSTQTEADVLDLCKDLPPLHLWQGAELGASFGSHLAGGAPAAKSQIVLLVRGQLLQRYPNASVFLARAAWDATGKRGPVTTSEKEPDDIRRPIFRGTLAPDITFLGFQITRDVAVGLPAAVDNTPGWFLTLEQHATEPRFGGAVAVPANTDAARLATSWLCRPVRLYIHASELL